MNLTRAIVLATQAHDGQVDKAGKPYILHPLRVMMRMANDEQRIVAVLHDTLEDTRLTASDLQTEGFSHHLVEAVEALTRKSGETYSQFVDRVIQNPLASAVKLGDLADNMDPNRNLNPTKETLDRLKKYTKARDRIITAMVGIEP